MKRFRHLVRRKKKALWRRARGLRNRQAISRALLLLEVAVLFGALAFALSSGRASLFAALGGRADIWATAAALV
ncbi:MAG TPA: hypothetical protein VJ715_19830, partial [Pyrinomonadaceae bacterium]|nr:hypothetical protein [Pyrinomonadaceae bacterium]